MLKLVSFHIQAHLNAFLQILEYFSQICLGPLARESLCIFGQWSEPWAHTYGKTASRISFLICTKLQSP